MSEHFDQREALYESGNWPASVQARFTPEELATAARYMALEALTKTLKPCPFCGGPAHIEASRDGGHHGASCRDDRCIGAGHRLTQGGPEKAAARWNKRAKN